MEQLKYCNTVLELSKISFHKTINECKSESEPFKSRAAIQLSVKSDVKSKSQLHGKHTDSANYEIFNKPHSKITMP